MSFIDLMADHEWSDADITAHTEAMVAAVLSTDEQRILTRKFVAASVGEWVLTPDELAIKDRFAAICATAHDEGVAARADMALLSGALAYERAQARLAQPAAEDDPDGTDASERAQVQATIDNTNADVLALVAQRAAARAPVTDASTNPDMEV